MALKVWVAHRAPRRIASIARGVIRSGMPDAPRPRRGCTWPISSGRAGRFGRHGEIADRRQDTCFLISGEAAFSSPGAQQTSPASRPCIALARNGPSRCAPNSCAPLPAVVSCNVCNTRRGIFRVVSGVSVRTLALNAVTPCVAKNAAILRKTRFVRRVHIHARSAMRMHIDKARRKPVMPPRQSIIRASSSVRFCADLCRSTRLHRARPPAQTVHPDKRSAFLTKSLSIRGSPFSGRYDGDVGFAQPPPET